MKPTDHINLLADRGLGRIVFQAIVNAFPGKDSPEMERITAVYRAADANAKPLPITCTVAGVTVSLNKAIEQLFTIRAEEINRLASERALELSTAAGLNELQEPLRSAEGQIKQALEKVGAEFQE